MCWNYDKYQVYLLFKSHWRKETNNIQTSTTKNINKKQTNKNKAQKTKTKEKTRQKQIANG